MSFTSCSTMTRQRIPGQDITRSHEFENDSLCVSLAGNKFPEVFRAQNHEKTMAAKETKPNYSPGLAGVIAGETEICWVDPNAGLAYRGYDIHQMAEAASFEEVAYLLLNGDLPDLEQLSKFTSDIDMARVLHKQVLDALRM